MGEDTSKPTPDPTVLTTEQMLRETENVREWAREAIAGLRDVNAEQFKNLDKQLDVIERQRIEQKDDTKDAVDRAFAAAKEAVGKSEEQNNTALKGLAAQFDTGMKAILGTVDDLKNRLTQLETERRTTATTRDQSRMDNGQVFTILGVCFTALGVAVAILVATR